MKKVIDFIRVHKVIFLVILLVASLALSATLFIVNYNIKQTAAYKTNSALVYVTPTGECYHKKNCRTIEKSTVTPIELDLAVKNYRACSVCRP